MLVYFEVSYYRIELERRLGLFPYFLPRADYKSITRSNLAHDA